MLRRQTSEILHADDANKLKNILIKASRQVEFKGNAFVWCYFQCHGATNPNDVDDVYFNALGFFPLTLDFELVTPRQSVVCKKKPTSKNIFRRMAKR